MRAEFLHHVYTQYEALNRIIPLDPEYGLGGKLLYAGNLANGTQLYAANIAGAASIAASADPAMQRQAIRDGAIDFLVTSLEEALRILKNEIRKHQPVSVGVGIPPTQLVAQMLDRGVLPDLLPDLRDATGLGDAEEAAFLRQGSLKIAKHETSDRKERPFITWSVDRDFARILPQIDALAQRTIPEKDVARHRWLRLAPRYLGRQAQRQHGVAMDENELAKFQSLVAEIEPQAGQLLIETRTDDEF